jgi:cell division protein FtsL
MPRLIALEHELKVTADLLKQTAAAVESMQREEEFAQRLADAMSKRKWSALSKVEKGLVLVYGSVPLVVLVLSLLGIHVVTR